MKFERVRILIISLIYILDIIILYNNIINIINNIILVIYWQRMWSFSAFVQNIYLGLN